MSSRAMNFLIDLFYDKKLNVWKLLVIFVLLNCYHQDHDLSMDWNNMSAYGCSEWSCLTFVLKAAFKDRNEQYLGND